MSIHTAEATCPACPRFFYYGQDNKIKGQEMRIPWKERVRADLIKRNDKYRGSGSWLNKALPFNHALRLNINLLEKVDFMLELFGITKRKENYINLEILIANLLYKRGKRPVRTSLNTTDWKITRYKKTGESTIKLINKLHEYGYIELKKGYRTEKESRISRIWPTDKFLDYFPKYDNAVINDPVEVVELRDDDGNLKEYKDTTRTRKIRAILTRVNKVNQSADINYKRYSLHAPLTAIFIRKFTLYGRLHSTGYRHYQGYSSDERKKITINNDSVVELDFSGLHPHLLYAKEEIQLDEDPYSIVDKRPVARTFLKQILLCMLNAKDELSAERAANYWLHKNRNQRYELNRIGITRAGPLMTEFRKVHKSIEHHFCNGSETGLRIMNLDSRIALDIIDHFAKQNITILAIHDSFIVQDKYRNELWQTMENTYEKHTNGFKCKIK